MNNTEKWLEKLEKEAKAMKAGFEQSATNIPIFKSSASIRSTITANVPGEIRRVRATFMTKNGADAVATVHVRHSSNSPLNRIRRDIYRGGARWIISVYGPDMDVFVEVQSMVEGTLSLENMRS